MKILILSFYYYPDLCAGSFRCTALLEQLKACLDSHSEMDLITTLPNRYSSFKEQAQALEQSENFTIRRIPLPTHQSGMIDQAKAFAAYAQAVNKHTKGLKYDIVFATSSRLMTAALGAWVAKQVGAKLYLDIRDLFADTIGDVLPNKVSFFLKPFFSFIEKRTVSRAKRINLISRGFESYFMSRYPKAEIRWFPHGIDPEFIQTKGETKRENTTAGQPLTILYAGNIGEGQGLHQILPPLAKKLEGKAKFKIIGDGGRKAQLKAALALAGCTNVELSDPIKRHELVTEYQAADILFLHLNDYEAFHRVLPSKLFEYAATGKPIWAGLAGYSASFVQSEISNAVVFPPCHVDEALQALSRLKLEFLARSEFVANYPRHKIMKDMALDILNM